jgi:membrane protease YdiL (CAAX protease family)
MSKARIYAKNTVLFVLTTTIVFLLQTMPYIQPARNYLAKHMGANWLSPLIFLLGALIGSFLIRVEREEETRRKTIFGGVLFVVCLYAFRYGLPHPNWKALATLGPFFFFTAYLEEFFFRRVGFEGMRKAEEKFYKEPTLKRLGPLSLLITCALYGTVHGFNPWSHGPLWDWARYASAFDASATFCLLYVATRSIWVPGTAHFLTGITRYLW